MIKYSPKIKLVPMQNLKGSDYKFRVQPITYRRTDGHLMSYNNYQHCNFSSAIMTMVNAVGFVERPGTVKKTMMEVDNTPPESLSVTTPSVK